MLVTFASVFISGGLGVAGKWYFAADFGAIFICVGLRLYDALVLRSVVGSV